MRPARQSGFDVAIFTPAESSALSLNQATFGAAAPTHLSRQSRCEQRHRRLRLNALETSGLGPLSHAGQRGLDLPPTCVVMPQRKPRG